MNRSPLENQVFGQLTVLHYQSRANWLCQCTCGRQVVVGTLPLRSGRTISCGCQKIKRVRSTPLTDLLNRTLIETIAKLLEATPGLTSRQLAEQVHLPDRSLLKVLGHLKRQQVVRLTKAVNRRSRSHWFLTIPIEQIAARLAPEFRPSSPSFSADVTTQKPFCEEVGITQEDQQWMQHYRAQYQNRYQRMGLETPIRKFG